MLRLFHQSACGPRGCLPRWPRAPAASSRRHHGDQAPREAPRRRGRSSSLRSESFVIPAIATTTPKRGPSELPAGQNKPEHGSINASPGRRFAQANANHRHDSSTEVIRPPLGPKVLAFGLAANDIAALPEERLPRTRIGARGSAKGSGGRRSAAAGRRSIVLDQGSAVPSARPRGRRRRPPDPVRPRGHSFFNASLRWGRKRRSPIG